MTANIVAPKAPTAPASLGVAQPNKIEPLIIAIKITGGRNAFSALYMWWRLCTTDYQIEIDSVQKCLDNAIDLENKLREMDKDFNCIDVQRAPYSLSVTFNSDEMKLRILGNPRAGPPTRTPLGDLLTFSPSIKRS